MTAISSDLALPASADHTDDDHEVIVLDGLSLKLASQAGEVNILRGIDLRVAAGETIGIVGPSGSGKSTMMMVLAGLEQPSSGTVRVAGCDLSGLDEDALATFRRQHLGIVFQNFHLIPSMTALENVAVPLELARISNAMVTARHWLDKVGLGQRLQHYPGQLSGGEQQRVALARAFASQPRLLLADEPTGNLDQATGRRIMDLLFDLHHQTGTTLLLITHDTALAARCGRVLHMEDGRLLPCSLSAVTP